MTTATGVLTIDLGALQDNWRLLNARAAPGRAAAVVKANGYGLGVERVAAALHQAGCQMFFVAHPDEGSRARKVLPAEIPIYVLNGFQPHADAMDDYAALGLRPVIGSEAELARMAAVNVQRAEPLAFAVHVDTGMNRLGLPPSELAAALARHGARGASLLMSHFVSAEEPHAPHNEAQMIAFETARAALPEVAVSLSNSSGLFLRHERSYDWARGGYALYGGNPTPGEANPMRAVASLDILIQQTRWIEAGETCGYNARWTAKRRSRLATLLAGYADGLPFGSGAMDGRPGASVKIGGVKCPLVGRISMDLTIADVTDAPQAEAGDWARFFGPDAPLDDFAASAGTIGYQVLTTLGPRYVRVEKAARYKTFSMTAKVGAA